MSERLFRVDDQCQLDEFFRLHYPGGVLEPCQEIYDSRIQIGIVDNNNINPDRLMLNGSDCQPVVVQIPKTGEIVKVREFGKTGIIYFSGRIDVSRFKRQGMFHLGGGIDRRDHLHVANIGQINNVGWRVYWAPLQTTGHVRHSRLVSPSGDVTPAEAQALAKVFKKYI